MNSTYTPKKDPDLDTYLQSAVSAIDRELDSLIPESNLPYARLFKAARYSLLGGGKRIRPILTLATAETLGCVPEKVIRTACALEMVHTYSLIHDDLPAMDNDDFRRGKPSLHKVFPEGHAILAGDFLLTCAFEVIARDSYLTPSQKVELIRLLSEGAGGHGMIAGQLLDLESEGSKTTIEHLQLTHSCKTGALIKTAILFGATIGNATQEQIEILSRFAKDIGLAFQIVDDILDVTEYLKNHGIPSSDVKNHKNTYVSLLGLEGAKEKAAHLISSAHTQLSLLPFETTRLKELADLIIYRRK